MLDRTQPGNETATAGARGPATAETLRASRAPGRLRRLLRFLTSQIFSSLTRRIVTLNIAGLLALVIGILYLSQFRAGLIDARVQSLLVQSEIIAGAIAASATVETDAITIDPDKLVELQTGDSYGPDESGSGLEFPISPERVAPVLRRLISPTNTRARIYDREGSCFSTAATFMAAAMSSASICGPDGGKEALVRALLACGSPVVRARRPAGLCRTRPQQRKGLSEVGLALGGQKASIVRVTDRGDAIVSVAVPIQRFRAVRGALLLSTQGGDIDQIVEAERLAIVKIFLIAAGVMVLLSVLLAGTIAGPVRRLAEGAERVRRRIRSRVEIPDFSSRRDEIGHLSRALRDMTSSLYSRIEAIESFAADVSHELKNPLTSLRSAVETLPLARSDDSRKRLLSVIEHDVRRLDRLITDISDASRLDAELQRQEAAPVDLVRLLTMVVGVANEVKRNEIAIKLTLDGDPKKLVVPGHDARIGQVVDNLIGNARSFSPERGSVRVSCRRVGDEVEIVVEDDGPGIRPDALEKIFERFYTDRPEQAYGQNSGLGLSISKQIIDAHGGRIWAENRMTASPDGGEHVAGARFTVVLPAL